MNKQHRVRTFKSGNSVAIRLPKRFGFVEGEEIEMVAHADGELSFWRARDAKDVFMKLYGSMSPGFMAHGRGDIEQEERDWSPRSPSQEAA